MLHYILKPKTVYLTRSFYFDWTVVQVLLGLNRARFLQLQDVEQEQKVLKTSASRVNFM